MPDPIQQAITSALDSADAEINQAAEDAAKAKGGDGSGAEAGAGAAGDDDKDKGAGADGAGAGDGDGGDGGEELDLAEVLEVAPAELTDEQKEFLVENKDDLTGKQIKTLAEAGVSFEADDKPVKGEGAVVKSDAKPHEVPADDSDLYVEVEDAEGNKVKITKIGDLPSDFIYKDSRQPLEIFEAIDELKEKKADRAKLRSENETLEDSNSTRERVATLWSSEITAMQADDTLPTGTIDWEKGEYPSAKAKEQVEGLFTFMAEENTRREKDGRPYIVSLRDVAVLKAQADAKQAAKDGKGKDGKTPEQLAQEAKDAAAKKEKARKVAGAQGDNGNIDKDDKPTYVKGSGKSITDITEEMISGIGA